ncbi:hypothetical protein [Mycobacterium shimoidei]|uniref:Integral membrane protein n=1 Tax=Mycobacterium shimoidei TaxID=29313 RepID=A0A1E3TEI3_MYCSH|nr:hypothetical protein [Mycobacterium shimoidei]ODR12844.1 hypothetical protein BHQ16_13220 [Mycobacterium shimoidei]SRX96287.1 hypothetical protein MSP7336_04564 [Mycobacterium shimoidei]
MMASVVLTRILSATCGTLMAAAVGIGSHEAALVAAMLCLLVVAVGVLFRPAATLAVLLTIAVIVLTNPAPALAAVSGLAAAVYLMLRHAASTGTGLDTVSGATIVGAVGFTLAGLVATAFPLQLPWLPLAAPLAILAIYVLVTRPFTSDQLAAGRGRRIPSATRNTRAT